MANAKETAAKAALVKTALAKVLRQTNNENTAKFFAAGMVGMMVLFMIFQWVRVTFKKYETQKGNPAALRVPVAISRIARGFLIRKVPGFTSAGHALIFVGYFATCLSIAFVNIDWSTLNNWAKRLGWVAISNLTLVTFLSLKNTPLAFLTAYSYERINILHQVAGYSTVFWAMLHAVVYIDAWKKGNELEELLETSQVVGIIAGISMFIILATALFLRKIRYEVFYVVHILMFMLIVVMIGLHRPDFTKHTIIITIFIGSMWFADRAFRFLKISFFSFGNTATISPLPHGGTRIILKKSSSRAVAGSHAFLWVPAIRATETHPFTIVSTNPLEFVVAAYDGFTSDLHKYALQNPDKNLKASIDGPYGNVPNFTDFTKVVLIAGGSGASFTFGIAVDLLRKLGNSTETIIEFIWAVREQESITWFAKELQELQYSPLVKLSIHATGTDDSTTSQSSTSSLPYKEKATLLTSEPTLNSPTSSRGSANLDIEKNLPSSSANSLDNQVDIKAGRPDVARMIEQVVKKAYSSDRIAVAACGPDGLMQLTRKTVADCIKVDGPSLELFLEQFGW